jgi:hypothetical protein
MLVVRVVGFSGVVTIYAGGFFGEKIKCYAGGH